ARRAARRPRRGACVARQTGRRSPMSNPERLRISGGALYDPANGIDGAVRDVCIEAERIVAELPRDAPRLDVAGMIVMAGGVDIHSHVAGPSVNHARRLLPEE